MPRRAREPGIVAEFWRENDIWRENYALFFLKKTGFGNGSALETYVFESLRDMLQRVALSQANLSLGFPSKSSLFAWGNSPKLKTKAAWGKASEGKLQISLGRSLGARRAWGRRHGGDVAACRCGICHALQWHL